MMPTLLPDEAEDVRTAPAVQNQVEELTGRVEVFESQMKGKEE
jgi:hypothetical protein